MSKTCEQIDCEKKCQNPKGFRNIKEFPPHYSFTNVDSGRYGSPNYFCSAECLFLYLEERGIVSENAPPQKRKSINDFELNL